jgi:hypothetical protein
MVVTQFAVIAFVCNLLEIRLSKLGDITLVRIDPVEQGVKRRAEVETPAAPVTDVIDSEGFLLELCTGNAGGDEVEALHGNDKR